MIDLGERWNNWLQQSIKIGSPSETIISAMTALGWTKDNASYVVYGTTTLDTTPTLLSDVIVPPFPAKYTGIYSRRREAEASTYVNDYTTIAAGNTIQTDDRIIDVVMSIDKPFIRVFDNVLSDEECDRLIERARPRLKPSMVVNVDEGESINELVRSSDTATMTPYKSAFMATIEKRIEQLLNWKLENTELMTVVHYTVGEYFNPHHDYFTPIHPSNQLRMQGGGQRVGTLIMYLNNVEEGGETIFPLIGLEVKPRKGSAVYFQYCNSNSQIDPWSYHGGRPVVKGEKWIMTKWTRQFRRHGHYLNGIDSVIS
jgi:prolyl 4-hydroxylase